MVQRDKSLVVLVSGNGSNLQAILDASTQGRLHARVVAVISNKKDAFALERACAAGIPAQAVVKDAAQTREEYDHVLAEVVSVHQPAFVVLAGWLRVLTPTFLDRFAGKVINLHPALPGTFPGLHAIERAWDAYRAGQITHTGVMIHRVVDAGVDDGPVLATHVVDIRPEDSLPSLEARVHEVEHRLLVDTLERLCAAPEGIGG